MGEAERLARKVLELLDGDMGFVVAEPWAKDGSWSKHDRCVHGNWRYDDCASCLDKALREAVAAALARLRGSA